MQSIYIMLLLVTLSSLASAFNFKSIIFGDKDDHQEASVPFGTPITESQKSNREDIPCNNYICEDTNVCVDEPKDCPCKLVTDNKCIVGDWYICIRGDQSCDQL